jgi:6,7-dimethyl-8-ribityllumazine synthase
MHKGKTPIQNISTGIPNYEDACVAIIKTEWNAPITNALEKSCIETIKAAGVNYLNFVVPGAVELPFAAKYIATVATHQNIKAIIVLGCVIKGGTPHFEYVCQSVTNGISILNTSLKIPVIFGVLTVLTEQQAMDRVKAGKDGDKGAEAALTALKMIAFTNQKL